MSDRDEFEAWWASLPADLDPKISKRLTRRSARFVWQAARRWRPISEAPRDGSHVTLYCPGRELSVVQGYGLSTGWFNLHHEHQNPTHFQPIPEPPNE